MVDLGAGLGAALPVNPPVVLDSMQIAVSVPLPLELGCKGRKDARFGLAWEADCAQPASELVFDRRLPPIGQAEACSFRLAKVGVDQCQHDRFCQCMEQLDERLHERRHPEHAQLQRRHSPGGVPGLVVKQTFETGPHAGQHLLCLEELEHSQLGTLSDDALYHDVVDEHGFCPCLHVAWFALQQVDRVLQVDVEDAEEAGSSTVAHQTADVIETVGQTEHLGEETAEEEFVVRLVPELTGQKPPLSVMGCGDDDRSQTLRHGALEVGEKRHRAQNSLTPGWW